MAIMDPLALWVETAMEVCTVTAVIVEMDGMGMGVLPIGIAKEVCTVTAVIVEMEGRGTDALPIGIANRDGAGIGNAVS